MGADTCVQHVDAITDAGLAAIAARIDELGPACVLGGLLNKYEAAA